jgi:hypothetical protein
VDRQLDLVDQYEQALSKIFFDAQENIRDANFKHVNILLNSFHWTFKNEHMYNLQKQITKKYGYRYRNVPLVAFSFNSDKTLLITFNIGTAFPHDRILSINQHIMDNFNSVINNALFSISEDVYQMKLDFKTGGKKTTFTCYDIILEIYKFFNIEKPFIVCVAGALSNRQMTFRDSNHKIYVTHQLCHVKVNLDNPKKGSDYATSIQKSSRICGKDSDSHVPRTLYMTRNCLVHTNKAFENNKSMIEFFVAHPGKTVRDIMSLAREQEIPVFRSIVTGNPWHKKKYSDDANIIISDRLPIDYLVRVLNYVEPPPVYQQVERIPEIIEIDEPEIIEIDEPEIIEIDEPEIIEIDEPEIIEIVDTSKPCLEFQRAFMHDLGQVCDLTKENNLEYALNTHQCTIGRNDDTWKSIARHLIDNVGNMRRLNEWIDIDASKLVNISLQTFKNLAFFYENHNTSWRKNLSKGSIIKIRQNQFKLSWR